MESEYVGFMLVSSPGEMMFVEYKWKRLPNQKSAVDFERVHDAVLPRMMDCIRTAFPS